jgi:hypothetical protein
MVTVCPSGWVAERTGAASTRISHVRGSNDAAISGSVAGVIDERDARWRGDGVRNLSAPAR